MQTSLLFTTFLVLALGSSAAAQDASCQAKATPVAAPVVVSDDDAPACCAEKAAPVAQGTLSDDEVAKLLKEVKAALAEVEGAVEVATGTEAAALPTALAALGYVSTSDERGYMGISMEIGGGAMTIQEVMEGGGAAAAGLRAGDRILTVDGKSAENAEALLAHLGGLQAGATVKITYERGGKKSKAKIELSTLAAIESAGEGEQRDLEKIEFSDKGVIEWIEVGEDDVVGEIMEIEEEHEHEARTFKLKGGNQEVHVVGADDLDLEALLSLEDIGVDLKGLEGHLQGLEALEGVQLKLEGLDALKALENVHLDLEELGDLKNLPGYIRININGEDIDVSELENLGGIFEVDVEVDDEHSGQHKIEFHDIQSNRDVRKQVIEHLGGQDGRHIIQFGNEGRVVVDPRAVHETDTGAKISYAIAVPGKDGEPQIIEIEGMPDGNFLKTLKLPEGIHTQGGNVIHLGHDDDDDSPTSGFFFSDDDHEVRVESHGQVIIKTRTDGGEPVIQEFTFGGEDGELPAKVRELLKSHRGMGQGIFVHEDGDHEFNVEVEEFIGGKGGNVRIIQGHVGGDDEDVLFFTDEDHDGIPESLGNVMKNRVRFGPGGGNGVWATNDDDEDSDSHGNVFLFEGDDHELPEGVREMLQNRMRFRTQGGNWAFTVDDDDDDHDHEHAGHDDDDHGVTVIDIDGGTWTRSNGRRINNQELGRRLRERVQLRAPQRAPQRVQLREVREERLSGGVGELEREIAALKDRIRELERALERLGRRR